MSQAETPQAAPAASAPPPTKLTSPIGVGIATVLCGPVSGFWLLSYNDSRLGKRGKGLHMALIGAAWTVAYSYMHYRLRADPALGWGLVLLNPVLIVWLAFALHGKSYREQKSRGEPGPSWDETIKRVLLGWFIYLAIVFSPEIYAELTGAKPPPAKRGLLDDDE